MNKKIFVIKGNNFSNLSEFYNEVEKVLTKNLNWKMGRNLDAFSDVLEGGFGYFEDDELITIKWENSKKSKIDLGYQATIRYLKEKLERCHPTAKEKVKKELKLAQNNKGKTIFNEIIEIIRDHKHIELILD